MANKQTKKIKKTELSIAALILIGILAVVNFASYQAFYRFDITQNKDYSISPISKRTVRNLDDIVWIKVYFSRNLPNEFLSLRQDVRDILDEYKNYANGKIKVEFIDPASDDKLEREVRLKGIPQLQFQVYRHDQMQLVNGYLGIEVSYGDKSDVIPVVEKDARNLEYQITTAIKKVTNEHIGTIGLLTSNGAASADNGLSQAYKKLRELYTVETVDLSQDKPSISATIDTLLIVGPTEKFSDSQLKAIDEFVMRGGALVVLADGVKINKGLLAEKNDIGLNKLLKAYGLTLNNDLVADVRHGYASFTQGYISFTAPYPFWPKIEDGGFSADSKIVSGLESAVLPWVSSLDISSDIDQEKTKISRLLLTTNNAWHTTDNFNLNPSLRLKPEGEQKQFVLGVELAGEVKSAFEKGKTAQAKIIVVGDSDFARDNLYQTGQDNMVLFQNLVDGVTFDPDLIAIRSKGVSSRPLKRDLTDSQRALIRYLNVFGVTIIVILGGLARYYLRRRRRFIEDLA